jgi:hypothetical protein
MNLKRVLFIAPLALLGFGTLITLDACSSSGPTTDQTGGTGGTGSTGGTSASGGKASATGGTSSTTGGATGTGGTGGSGAVAGASAGGSAGVNTAGSAGTGTMTAFPTVPNCPNVGGTLNNSCARIGCHKGQFASASLDLTPDTGFVGRVKDVVATHKDIVCGTGTDTCVPATCPSGVKLVDSTTPANSWILQKLDGTENGCGATMPTSGYTITADEKTCLESLVNVIAGMH